MKDYWQICIDNHFVEFIDQLIDYPINCASIPLENIFFSSRPIFTGEQNKSPLQVYHFPYPFSQGNKINLHYKCIIFPWNEKTDS